ncbi:NAD(P)-dependent oxidoreductase [Xanthomonas tesorieronis]|uniref:NAD(P)-dependent oxidoreductase n=1 Tax=Xanthomonas tesorieronis TaxID=3160839 RepID=UPI003518C1CC
MQQHDSGTIEPERPKILVLGATGGTGRLIVGQALARGYDVAALVRSRDAARHLGGARLIVGDARDEAFLRQALHGRDSVISALGTPASPRREVTLLSTATRALLSAMKAEQVGRLIAITGLGAGDSAGHGGVLFDKLIFPLLLRKVYADKNRQEALIRDSGLDWVLVRPTVLNDKPARGDVRAITDLSGFHGGSIARADVATFVLDQVTSNAWLHRAPLITW